MYSGLPRTLTCALAALLLQLSTAPRGESQEVRGRLTGQPAGEPLAGAYVQVMDGSGRVSARSITDAQGLFRLGLTVGGGYTLRAEHIGFEPVEAVVEVPANGTVWAELRAYIRPVVLDGLVAEVDRSCLVPDEVASSLVSLWDDVSIAFRVTELIEDRGLYRFQVDRWTRRLEPNRLRVVEEERRSRAGFHAGSPFESLEPSTLSERGYIHEGPDGGNRYVAPDVRVLMSPEFLGDHCLGLTLDPPTDGDEGWVGIRFRPRDSRSRHIEGTLWIDSGSLQPRRLDYRYRNLPRNLTSDDVGGRVEFFRLPEGPWIVWRWRIRMPIPQVARRSSRTAAGRSQLRYEIAGYVEEGGEVVRVRTAEDRTLALGDPGRVEGVVTRHSGVAVAGAHLELRGTALRAVADSMGRFAIEGVPQGRYEVSWSSPVFDSLGLKGISEEVVVPPGGVARVDAYLPELQAALTEQCTEPLDPDGTGVLWGRVLRRGAPVGPEETVVRISWKAPVDVDVVGAGLSVREGGVGALLPVERGGHWKACGVPHLRSLEVAAHPIPSRGREAGRAVTAHLEPGGAADLTLRLPAEGELPKVIPLDPLDVTVDRTREMLRDVGLSQDELGRRFMARDDIEEALGSGARDMEGVLRRLRLPGVVVDRISESGVAEVGDLCVTSYRYRSFSNYEHQQFCAQIYIDGMPSDAYRLDSLSPEDVKSVAFLREAESGAMFGTGTPGGVLFVWTR